MADSTLPVTPKTNKSPAMQAAVANLRAANKSKSQIARQLHINHRTVTKILSLPEIAKYVDEARSIVSPALPRAAQGVVEHIDNGNLSAQLAALKGMGAFRNDDRMQVGVAVGSIADWAQLTSESNMGADREVSDTPVSTDSK